MPQGTERLREHVLDRGLWTAGGAEARAEERARRVRIIEEGSDEDRVKLVAQVMVMAEHPPTAEELAERERYQASVERMSSPLPRNAITRDRMLRLLRMARDYHRTACQLNREYGDDDDQGNARSILDSLFSGIYLDSMQLLGAVLFTMSGQPTEPDEIGGKAILRQPVAFMLDGELLVVTPHDDWEPGRTNPDRWRVTMLDADGIHRPDAQEITSTDA